MRCEISDTRFRTEISATSTAMWISLGLSTSRYATYRLKCLPVPPLHANDTLQGLYVPLLATHYSLFPYSLFPMFLVLIPSTASPDLAARSLADHVDVLMMMYSSYYVLMLFFLSNELFYFLRRGGGWRTERGLCTDGTVLTVASQYQVNEYIHVSELLELCCVRV